MNITVIGAGYVGLVTGACFAELGNHVTCVDINPEKIQQLNLGVIPIYEPGLDTLILSNRHAGRINFVTSLDQLEHHPDIIFIAVGTPSNEDGAADLKYVLEAAKSIGRYIQQYCVIVDKSTVPVGMAQQVSAVIRNELTQMKKMLSFDVVSNPEFLREGAAIDDFMKPDRIIIGASSEAAKKMMLDLYLPLMRNPEKIYFMNVKDAEMTKYVANAMLATRISFMNEMAVICDELGVDIENVRMGIGADHRIGPHFLNAGCGYGGSCFPKDVKALIKIAEKHQIEPLILNAVERRNALQKEFLVEKIIQLFGADLSQTKLGVWGLSFKPDTDDMREASSVVLINKLLELGAHVSAYDPVAIAMAKKVLKEHPNLTLVADQYTALDGVDALILVTEWKSFCYPDLSLMKQKMKKLIILDGRNQYDLQHMITSGFEYYGVGRSSGLLTESAVEVLFA